MCAPSVLNKSAEQAPAPPAPPPAHCVSVVVPGSGWLRVRFRAARCQPRSCIFENRNASKQQARQYRHSQSEQQYCPVDANFIYARQALRRHRHQQRETQHKPCQPKHAAHNPSTRLSNSSSAAMRLQPAPKAARIASSCRRPSTRTSTRLATLAHAISSTMPIDAINTQRSLPTSPTTRSFNGLMLGVKCASSNIFRLKPGGGESCCPRWASCASRPRWPVQSLRPV